ncbi:hypothetical protein WR25_20149 [Diploscapter pachys]|uniref:Uncharacterized protein n=1 Tax=Diploscapter pachys TaxID=2018661 RepID=A0A2A2KLE8_9BILA|nr:hypothetical protein WR25_20149 [Diploscapter pachys]
MSPSWRTERGQPFDQHGRAVGRRAFLVAGDEQAERRAARARRRGDEGGDCAFHIDRAATVEQGPADVAGPGGALPPLAGRHDVDVAGEGEMRARAFTQGDQVFDRAVGRVAGDDAVDREADGGERRLQHVEHGAARGGDAVGAEQRLGVLDDRVDIGGGEARDGELVGNDARADGGEHDVRRTEVAEQEGAVAAEAGAGLRPQFHDALEIYDDVLVGALGREDLADVHRVLAPQCDEARVHFRRHRAGHGACRVIGGPEAIAPDLVGEIVDDGETVPHHRVAIPQDRHLARRGREFGAFAAAIPFGVVQRHDDLFEGEAGLLGGEPAPQGPAGIGLVADDELHGAGLAAGCDEVQRGEGVEDGQHGRLGGNDCGRSFRFVC